MSAFPLAAWPGFRTDDAEHARRHISRFFRVHGAERGQETGRIAFRHHHAALGDITVNALRYGSDIQIQSRPLKDFYLIQWTLEGHCRFGPPEHEVVAAPGSIYVVNPFELHRKQWGRDCVQIIFRVDRDRIDRHLSQSGVGEAGPVGFAAGPHERTADTAVLFDLFALVVGMLDARSPQTGNSTVVHALQETFIGLLLATIPNDRIIPGMAAASAPPRHLREAIDFIKVHAREPIGPAEVARAVGVRPRTLQNAFQSHLGLSPGAYLKGVRLDLVRRDLEEGGADGPSVTEIATDCGFQHMGRFARDFRDRFGVKPSAWRAGSGAGQGKAAALEKGVRRV